MAAYLLVTAGHPLQRKVYEQLFIGDTFGICVPVLTETVFGFSVLPRALQNRAQWEHLYPLMTTYGLDETDGTAAAMLQVQLRRQGRQLETVDALIAAMALRHDLVLLTTDRDFRAVPSLRRENWLNAT